MEIVVVSSVSHLPGMRFPGYGMHIGRRGGHRVNQLSAAIDAYVGFHVPLVALLHLNGSRLRSLFLVELGASMIEASTMVPVLTVRPLSSRYSAISANN